HGSAGKPVDDCSAGNQAENEGCVEQREVLFAFGKPVREAHDDGKDHGGSAHNRGTDEHRLGGGFEGVSGAIIFFEHVFGAIKLCVEAEVFLKLLLNIGHLFNQREFVDR